MPLFLVLLMRHRTLDSPYSLVLSLFYFNVLLVEFCSANRAR